MMEHCNSNSKLATTGQTNVWQAVSSTYICSNEFPPPFSSQSAKWWLTFPRLLSAVPNSTLKTHTRHTACPLPEEVSATAEIAFLILTSSSFLPSGLQISFKASSWVRHVIKATKGIFSYDMPFMSKSSANEGIINSDRKIAFM